MSDSITLTDSQQRALNKIVDFVASPDHVFILKGYAGTGKTTLMRFLIEKLQEDDVPFRLLSTTGRAAKILSNHTGFKASTIHAAIYSFKDFNQDMSNVNTEKVNVDETGQLFLVFEPVSIPEDDNRMVYIIDEASMISDTAQNNVTQALFGSGKLLTELLEFDKRKGSRFIFVGDPCQLPPISGTNSPALDVNYMKETFKFGVQETALTQVMRQQDGNTIVNAASTVRTYWSQAPSDASIYGNGKVWGILNIKQFRDIKYFKDLYMMQEDYVRNIHEKGYNDSIFVCRSNADCYKVSNSIRSKLGFHGSVQKGDLLMVMQNQMTTGLMNGDMVEVVSVQPAAERTVHSYNHRGFQTQLYFREIKVKELFTKVEHTTLILENTLEQQMSNLDSRQQTGLFLDFIIRMKNKGITQKNNAKTFKELMCKDPYLNALRCSYGYAVTCHKAQGGEWNKVYIHIGPRNLTLNPTKASYQWLYTAITRGKETVYLIDDFFIK